MLSSFLLVLASSALQPCEKIVSSFVGEMTKPGFKISEPFEARERIFLQAEEEAGLHTIAFSKSLMLLEADRAAMLNDKKQIFEVRDIKACLTPKGTKAWYLRVFLILPKKKS